jgi:hypothetical protein
MRSVLAVFFSFVIFLLSWFINAFLVGALAMAAVYAGAGQGLFLILNIIFIWIICPGIGAFVAVSGAIKKFIDVEVNTIFVGFVSVCAVLIILFFLFSVSLYFMELNNFWSVIVLLLQSASIIFGARFGKMYALSKRYS